jgi:hypothetical protein
METNLPELCRRVWKVAPKAQPESVRVHGEMIVGSIGMDSQGYIDAIQAAALRWLLRFVAHMSQEIDSDGFYRIDLYRTDGEWSITIASVKDTDLTTCLLLAVERCQEYKESADGK